MGVVRISEIDQRSLKGRLRIGAGLVERASLVVDDIDIAVVLAADKHLIQPEPAEPDHRPRFAVSIRYISREGLKRMSCYPR